MNNLIIFAAIALALPLSAQIEIPNDTIDITGIPSDSEVTALTSTGWDDGYASSALTNYLGEGDDPATPDSEKRFVGWSVILPAEMIITGGAATEGFAEVGIDIGDGGTGEGFAGGTAEALIKVGIVEACKSESVAGVAVTTNSGTVTAGGGMTILGVGGNFIRSFVLHTSTNNSQDSPWVEPLAPMSAVGFSVSVRTLCSTNLSVTGDATGQAESNSSGGAIVVAS